MVHRQAHFNIQDFCKCTDSFRKYQLGQDSCIVFVFSNWSRRRNGARLGIMHLLCVESRGLSVEINWQACCTLVSQTWSRLHRTKVLINSRQINIQGENANLREWSVRIINEGFNTNQSNTVYATWHWRWERRAALREALEGTGRMPVAFVRL